MLQSEGNELPKWMHESIPEGYEQQQPPHTQYVSNEINEATPTNKWWSSLVWKPFSSAMYPHPFAVKAYSYGLAVTMPPVQVKPNEHVDGRLCIDGLFRDGEHDLVLSGDTLETEAVYVDGWGDWSVEARFQDSRHSARNMRVTLAHGSPYAFGHFTDCAPAVTFRSAPESWGKIGENIVGVTTEGRHYGLFLPNGMSFSKRSVYEWVAEPDAYHTYVAVAVLPEATMEMLHRYAQHAYSPITDTKVSWQYESETGLVHVDYVVTTTSIHRSTRLTAKSTAVDPVDSTDSNVSTDSSVSSRSIYSTVSIDADVPTGSTIMCLYPHQWKYVQDPDWIGISYPSPRGEMKGIVGSHFRTTMAYPGLLPFFPNSEAIDREHVNKLFEEAINDIEQGHGPSTYWTGKRLGKLAQLLGVAMAMDSPFAEHFAQTIQQEWERWFTSPSELPCFTYNWRWSTIIGYPSGFGADIDLNDHHFHYGYWVYAAAMLALYEPKWLTETHRQQVEALLVDFANIDRQQTTHFPYLRNFDPYAGHSWASGKATDVSYETETIEPGNNQESSSEAIHAWAGLILWGEVTENDAWRDAGMYMYTTEVEAALHYWFDIDECVFPAEYPYRYCPIVYSSGAEYRTWWTLAEEEIHGINMLPLSGASLYLGRKPSYVLKLWEIITDGGKRPLKNWQDILWMYVALGDAELARHYFETNTYKPEDGESRAHTYQWISHFVQYGHVDQSWSANTICFAVFVHPQRHQRTYIAYNMSGTDRLVTFTHCEREEQVTLQVDACSFLIHTETVAKM